MKKLACSLWLVVYGLFLLRAICYAQPISSTELINNAKQYDGKIVVYAGEAIGDIMKRGEFAWVNVNDGSNAIGIWVNSAQINDITVIGGYKKIGDAIEVTGVFHRACPEHGGDLDIHAQAVRKIASGRRLQERLNVSEINFAVILLGILGAVWILTLLKRK